MTVNHNATRAGKKFETDLMKYMREEYKFDVERLRLTGAEDEGDLLIRRTQNLDRYVIEAKRTKSLDLSGWVNEAKIERINYAAHRGIQETSIQFPSFVVVHYARGKGLGGSYVTTTLDEWLSRL